MQSNMLFLALSESQTDDIYTTVVAVIIFAFGIIAALVYSRITRSRERRRARWFKSPFPESGAVTPMPNLTPAEAGIVMSVNISRLLAMYLLDLATFEDVEILGLVPLRVRATPQENAPGFRKAFLGAVESDGSLDAREMLFALDTLFNSLKDRFSQYSVENTVKYYLKKIDILWQEIEKEHIGAEKIETLQKQFPWLLLHEEAADRLTDIFSSSKHWTTVQPIVKMLRLVKENIIREEQLLEHAANYPTGVFSNPGYLREIANWARLQLSVAPGANDKYFWMSEEKQENFKKAEKKKEDRRIRIAQLLKMVESFDV